MAMFIRAKRVSDPLDDRAKARLRGGDDDSYASSGSEHEADALFSGPIHAFLDIGHDHDVFEEHLLDRLGHVSVDSNDDGDGDVAAADSDEYCTPDDFVEEIRDLLDPSRKSDPFLARLHSDVAAIAIALGASGRMGSNRSVMTRLRGRGYNAGICKARWESSGSSLTAGSYEYIDVVVDDDKESSRYVVDIEFAAEFTVARATEEYSKLVAALPRVMVGRGEEVKQVLRIMAEATKRSMKSRELSVPPWRKRRYMLAKWFGPYRRTTSALPSSTYRRTVNVLPSSAAVAPAKGSSPEEMIKCRAVGFVATAPEIIDLPPLATRTR